jgi:hypothetical protein
LFPCRLRARIAFVRWIFLLLLLGGCGPSHPSLGNEDFAGGASDGASSAGDLGACQGANPAGCGIGAAAPCPSPNCDYDGDGYTPAQGDCDDTDPLVNPGAIEVPGNKVDDDCDGLVDEAEPRCTEGDGNDGPTLAAAMGLCAPWLKSAQVNPDADPSARAARPDFGSYLPMDGTRVALLDTGVAADEDDAGFVLPQPGTAFHNDDPNPDPSPKSNLCYTGADELTVHDYVELTLTLQVPTNAKSFSFNFLFVSSEYPEYVGSAFNDKFLALLDSQAYKGNISFDRNGNPITVNVGFFDVCDTELVCMGQMQNVCSQNANALAGTGYELGDGTGLRIGGGTGWLTTYSPVKPGETATLRFIIFDEYDHLFDSAVIIDNFQWQLTPATMPMTIG